MDPSKKSYIGRFAPSPSGPLHFGSLVAALGSFLQARSKNGKWLLRIEDIDPPREVEGASALIIQALETYGLYWDDTILYQSDNILSYQTHLQQLTDSGNTFHCSCTRAKIKQAGGFYPGFCKGKNLAFSEETSVRYLAPTTLHSFVDQLLGDVDFDSNQMENEFVLKRKDGLFAYQLAVVVDDIKQNITEVVRGADLLDSTPKQIQLFQSFNVTPPQYLHLPLVINSDGNKLSKQNHATAISLDNPIPTLIKALEFLGQSPPAILKDSSINEILSWAIENWNIHTI